MHLIPLGTNGFIPSFGRHTMSFLILTARQAIVLDAGTGLGRLLEPEMRQKLRSYTTLNVILSHYHLDHVVGLSYLPAVWPEGPVNIYGPGPPFVQTPPDASLDQLLRPPLFSVTLREFPVPVSVITLQEDTFKIDGVSIRIRPQKHPGGSVGIRLEDKLVYMTDTVVDPSAESFMRAAKLLLHEVWLTDEEAQVEHPEQAGHSFASGVVELASRARVKRLMPVHFHPKRSAEDLDKLGKELSGGGVEIVMPREGETYAVD